MTWRVPRVYGRALQYAAVAVLFHLLWPRFWSSLPPHSPNQLRTSVAKRNVDFAWGSILHHFQNHPVPPSRRIAFPWSVTQSERASDSTARVLIVTSELAGLNTNGGIGTAYSELSLALAEDIHLNVSVLVAHTEDEYPVQQVRKLRTALLESNVALHFVNQSERSFFPEAYTPLASHWVQLFLRRHDEFDVVHLPDNTGIGYFSALAKKEGLMLQNTKLVVGLHGAEVEWAAMLNKRYPSDKLSGQQQEFEKRTAEMADAVVSPSEYMLEYLRKRGWQLPSAAFVIPNIVKASLTAELDTNMVDNATAAPVTELVFFGRLEERKGVRLFIEALEFLLESGTSSPLTSIQHVTWLGRDHPDRLTHIDASTLITQALLTLQQASTTNFTFGFIKDFDRDEALSYLRAPHRLAVLPSLADNSPSTVLECIANDIRFVAANVGGVPELINESYHDAVLFRPLARDFAGKLLEIVREDKPREHARPRMSDASSSAAQDWINFHHWIVSQPSLSETSSLGTRTPLVSICITHFERVHLLPQLLKSLRRQTYAHFEVILVDDGSSSDKSVEGLQALEEQYFGSPTWTLLRINNSYLGEARNRAAQDAQGEYLLFLDDDDVLKPSAVQRLVEVSHKVNATALSTWLDEFATDVDPYEAETNGTTVPHRRTYWFLGQSLSLGIQANCFGSGNIFVQRVAFEALGGFSTYRQVGGEDWEFYIRLALHGYSQFVVPEELIWVRSSPNRASMKWTMDSWDAGYHALLPLLNDDRIHALGLSHALLALKGLSSAPTPSPIVADSLYDFQLQQGWNGWTYSFVPVGGDLDDETYRAVPVGAQWSTRKDYPTSHRITERVQAPFVSELGVSHHAVRTFTSPKTQGVSIHLQYDAAHSCGDGTLLTLRYNEGGVQEARDLFSVKTMEKSHDILYFDVPLYEGSSISLVSDPLQDGRCDDVSVHVTLNWIDRAGTSWSNIAKRKAFEERQGNEVDADSAEEVADWVAVGYEEVIDDGSGPDSVFEIALIFDEHRYKHALQVIRSAIHFITSRQLHVHAITPPGLHDQLRNDLDVAGVHLQVYDHSLCYDYARQVIAFSDPSIHISAHCKMFLSLIMPTLERVLYLDTDTTILGDISACYQQPSLPGPLMSMAADLGDACQLQPDLCWPIGLHWRVSEGLVCGNVPLRSQGEEDLAPYCALEGQLEPFQLNGGVILMELERMRNSGFVPRYVQTVAYHFSLMGSVAIWGEQDFINSYFRLFPGDLEILPCGCNYQWFGQRTEIKCGSQPIYIAHAWSHGIATRSENPYNRLFYHFLDTPELPPPLSPPTHGASAPGSPDLSFTWADLETNINCPIQAHDCGGQFLAKPYGEPVTVISLVRQATFLLDLLESVDSQTYRHIVHSLGTQDDDGQPFTPIERRTVPLHHEEGEDTMPLATACQTCASTMEGTCGRPPTSLSDRTSFFKCVCNQPDPSALLMYDLEAQVETGWVLHLSEDRVFTSPTSVALLMSQVDHRDQIILFRSNTSSGRQEDHYRSKTIPESDLDGLGYLFHSSHLALTEWDDRLCGAWRVLDRLVSQLHVKWIDQVPTIQHPLWPHVFGRTSVDFGLTVVIAQSLGHPTWTKEVVATLADPSMSMLVQRIIVRGSNLRNDAYGPAVMVVNVTTGSGLVEIAAYVDTKGVLLLSDTIRLTKPAITAMVNFWLSEPARIVGPFTEEEFEEFPAPLSEDADFNFRTEPDPALGQIEYSQVLPRVLMTSASHLRTLSTTVAANPLHPICHSILLGALAGLESRLPPLRLLLPPESLMDYVHECRIRRVPLSPGVQPGDSLPHEGEEVPSLSACSDEVRRILKLEEDWMLYGDEVGMSGLQGMDLGIQESANVTEAAWKAVRIDGPCRPV